MIRIKMKGLKYTIDEVVIDISPEGMDALNAKMRAVDYSAPFPPHL